MEPDLAQRMQDHVRSLARRNRIHLTWTEEWRRSESWPDTRTAVVPVICQPSDYLVALHELGHCLDRSSRAHHDRRQAMYSWVACEGMAWAWATKHADRDLVMALDQYDWTRIAHCFRSHLQWAVSQDPEPSTVRHSPETE